MGNVGATSVTELSAGDKKEIFSTIEKMFKKVIMGSKKQGEVSPGMKDMLMDVVSKATKSQNQEVRNEINEMYENQLEIIDATEGLNLDKEQFSEIQANVLDESLTGSAGQGFMQKTLKPAMASFLTSNFMTKVFENKAVKGTLNFLRGAADFVTEKAQNLVDSISASAKASRDRIHGLFKTKMKDLFGAILDPIIGIKDAIVGLATMVYDSLKSIFNVVTSIANGMWFVIKNITIIIYNIAQMTVKLVFSIVMLGIKLMIFMTSLIISTVTWALLILIPFLVMLTVKFISFMFFATIKFILFTIALIKILIVTGIILAKVLIVVAIITLVLYFIYTVFMFFYDIFKYGFIGAISRFFDRWDLIGKISAWWEESGQKLIDDMLNGIGSWLGFGEGELQVVMQNAWDMAVSWFQKIADWFPIIKDMIDVIANIVNGIVTAIDFITRPIQKVYELGKRIAGVVDMIWDTSAKALDRNKVRKTAIDQKMRKVTAQYGTAGGTFYLKKAQELEAARVRLVAAEKEAEKIRNQQAKLKAINEARNIYEVEITKINDEYKKNLAQLATGGIITKPIVAQLAEQSNDEAVIPLNETGMKFFAEFIREKLPAILNKASGSAKGMPIADSGLKDIREIIDSEIASDVNAAGNPIPSTLMGVTKALAEISNQINEMKMASNVNVGHDAAPNYIDMIASGQISNRGR